MTRRPGFTLFEIMIALTITGIVALLAYGTASAVFDTREHVDQYQQTVRSELLLRSLLLDALRHPPAPGGSAMNDTLFAINDRVNADGVAADEVYFFTRGLSAPQGASEKWFVRLAVSNAGLHLQAAPVNASSLQMPIDAVLPDVKGLDVHVLDRAADREWQSQWSAVGRVPAAVKIEFVRIRAPIPMSPLVVHAALEPVL